MSTFGLKREIDNLSRQLAHARYTTLRLRVGAMRGHHTGLDKAWYVVQAYYVPGMSALNERLTDLLDECEALADRYQWGAPTATSSTQGDQT